MDIKEINRLLRNGICPEQFIFTQEKYTETDWEKFFPNEPFHGVVEPTETKKSEDNIDGGKEHPNPTDK